MSAEEPIPLRADPAAIHRDAVRSLTRAVLSTARTRGRALDYARETWPNDQRLQLLLRGATAPTSTIEAAALQTVAKALLDSLKPISAAGPLIDRGLTLTFGPEGAISVPTFGIAQCGFVGEGARKPVDQFALFTPVLKLYKFAAIVQLTNELISSSNAEALVSKVLRESIALGLDHAIFSLAPAVNNVRPAGLLSGVAPLDPAPAGSTAMQSDLTAIVSAIAPVVSGPTGFLIVAAVPQALATQLQLLRVVPEIVGSAALPARSLLAVATQAFVIALGAPKIERATQAVLLEQDARPAESPGDFQARYNYATPNNTTAPISGQISHATKSEDQIQISNVDLDGVDHAAFFATLVNGDTLTIDWATWTITGTTPAAGYITLQVTPVAQRLQAAEYVITIHPASAAPVIQAPTRSLFQTDTIALKLTMPLSFAMRAPGVAWVENVNWP